AAVYTQRIELAMRSRKLDTFQLPGPTSSSELRLTVRVGEQDLSTRLAALVIRQASSDRLTADQRSALRSWIEQGGQLIVAGGPGWRRSMDGLDDLLPVEGLATRQSNHLRAFEWDSG